MKVHAGRNGSFQVFGIIALCLMFVILPVSANGIVPVPAPGILQIPCDVGNNLSIVLPVEFWPNGTANYSIPGEKSLIPRGHPAPGYTDGEPVAPWGNPLPVPYIHQVYDTPANFSGTGACAPTSAVMVLSYYHLFSKHTITIPETPATGNSSEVPAHQNDYGYYVSENYTYDGIVYPAGANGFIWKDNNTIVNLEQYLVQHGMILNFTEIPSETLAEEIVRREIDTNHPVIARTYLSGPGGHYAVVVGYGTDTTGNFTYIVNDPFGHAPYHRPYGDYIYQTPQPVQYHYPDMKLDVPSRGLLTVHPPGESGLYVNSGQEPGIPVQIARNGSAHISPQPVSLTDQQGKPVFVPVSRTIDGISASVSSFWTRLVELVHSPN